MKKRILCLFLCITLLVGVFPTTIFAENDIVSTNGTQVGVSGTNSVGNLLAKSLNEFDTALDSHNCVQDVTVEMDIATVQFSVFEDAELVVGIYNESTGQLMTSGKAMVHNGDTEATVQLEKAKIPQYFKVEAFLLSAEDYTPLCKSFSTPIYTQAFQMLLDSSIDDFDANLVLNLDENKDTNFAVYSENVRRSVSDGMRNTVLAADDTTLRYVIDNPDSTVTSLKTGDFWACESESDILIVKVASLTIQDGKAVIIGQETSMEEVFDYAKIEGTADAEDAVIDPNQMAEGVTYNGMVEMKDESDTRSWEGEDSLKIGWSFSVFYEDKGESASAKVELGLELSVTTTLKYYIARSDSFISFSQEYKMDVKGKVEGKLELCEIPLTQIPVIVPICGLVNVELEPNFVVEFTASFSVETSLTWSTGMIYAQDRGFTDTSTEPTTETDFSIEGKLFIGASFKIKFCIISSYICSIGISLKAGAEAKTEMTGQEYENGKLHECDVCLDGTIHIVLKADVSAELFKLFKESCTLAEVRFHVGDFYWSLTYGEAGFGDCPHWHEEEGKTSETLASGTCGENLTWTLDSNGVLTISGTGEMYDFDFCLVPWESWKNNIKTVIIKNGVTSISDWAFFDYSALTSVTIPDTVRIIGAYAFFCCTGLTNVTIPSGVTSIGKAALAGCTGLTSITIPSNVTSISYFAFSDCTGLANVYFCGDAPSIFESTFYNVTATAYYPSGNSTWTATVKQNYGGILTWVAWTPTNAIQEESETVPHAIRGLYTGKQDGNTVSFTGLTAGEQYVLIVSKNKSSDLLERNNLLYIAQAPAGEDGTMQFTMVPRESYADAFIGLYGKGASSPEQTPCDGGENCPSGKFVDVNPKEWYHPYVDYAVTHGLFGGTSVSTFEPESAMTRAMLVTVLWRYEGQPKGYENTFSDVNSKDGGWYIDAVAWAASNNIVGGVGNGKFDPEGNITREQMATILFRYAEKKGIDTSKRGSLNIFSDEKQLSAYAKDAVQWAVAEQIINGSDGKLLPQGSATRAQVATILMRFIENKIK